MVVYFPVQRVWILSVLYLLLIHQFSCDLPLNFGSTKDVCKVQCDCYSWSSNNITQRYDRFTVNCTRMRFALLEGFIMPKPLPINTTDLLVKDYLLRTLSINSFDNNRFPLNPQLIRLELLSCHINYISDKTFSSYTLQSLHHVDLKSNMLEELHENTFSNLFKLKTLTVAKNYIRKVGRHTFTNLYQVTLINISHNWLEHLDSDAFYRIPSLEILDLSHNWLKNLPWKNISQLLSLKILGLKGNPWNCSCQMKGILKLNHSLLNGTLAACRFPQLLNGTLLEDLNSDTFSHCFTSKQYFKSSEILTLVCIILLFLYVLFESGDTRCIGNIKYNINDALDQFGTVYKGELSDGRKAAIKVIRKHLWMDGSKELKILLHLSEEATPHPNIIRYLWREPPVSSDKDRFLYLALDLCDGNLFTAVMHRISGFDNIVDPRNYFSQLTEGICFLHEHGIQHRDIKPQNILWKRTVTGIALIISDFDLGHFSQERSMRRVMYGTLGWSAPEMCDSEQSRSDHVDVFSLGCVFYFILTREHPFGAISDPEECQQNIICPDYVASLNGLHDHLVEHMCSIAKDLISRMICLNASDRIKDYKIRKHPLLFRKEDLANFLIAICNYLKDSKDPRITRFKEVLEENSHRVFDGKWLDKLDTEAKNDLKVFKRKGDQICSLLIAVRNKITHFHELPVLLREIYLGSKFGVVEYYMKRFPNLVPYTYSVLVMNEFENLIDWWISNTSNICSNIVCLIHT